MTTYKSRTPRGACSRTSHAASPYSSQAFETITGLWVTWCRFEKEAPASTQNSLAALSTGIPVPQRQKYDFDGWLSSGCGLSVAGKMPFGASGQVGGAAKGGVRRAPWNDTRYDAGLKADATKSRSGVGAGRKPALRKPTADSSRQNRTLGMTTKTTGRRHRRPRRVPVQPRRVRTW